MRRPTTPVLMLASAGLLAMGMTFQTASSPTVSAAEFGDAEPAVGFTSDNVEWVSYVPGHQGTAGGILHEGHYYVTDPRGVYIYDVADPEAPDLVGTLIAPQGYINAAVAMEEPDTNGEILLVNAYHPEAFDPEREEQVDGHAAPSLGATPLHGTPSGASPAHGAHPGDDFHPPAQGWLLVVDVSDRTDPHVIGSLDVQAHTWTCVLDCSYAVGREGHVVDLTDPTDPHVIADWREHVDGDGYMHHFTEVAPGRVIGSGQPSFYLDLTDPEDPAELARIESDFHSLGHHGSIWPNGATDPLMLIGAEVAPEGPTNLAGSDCDDGSTYAVATYDATDVIAVDERQFNDRDRRGQQRGEKRGFERQRGSAGFVELHEWRIDGRGVYADGYAPAHTLYCGHWFEAHPDWDAGGVLNIAHYNWGVRFLDVAADGSMSEIGWWQPVGGFTGAASWITEEVLYVHDYHRGIDILRFTGTED